MDDKAKILDVLKNIEASFSKLDVASWLECFHLPRIMVLPQVALAPSSEAECRELLEPYFENLREQGFDRSNLEEANIKFLTDTTAMVGAVWTRYASDTIIERFGATYLFLKSDDSWLITMVTPHPDNVTVVQAE